MALDGWVLILKGFIELGSEGQEMAVEDWGIGGEETIPGQAGRGCIKGFKDRKRTSPRKSFFAAFQNFLFFFYFSTGFGHLEIASCMKLFYICSSPASFSVPIKINFPF